MFPGDTISAGWRVLAGLKQETASLLKNPRDRQRPGTNQRPHEASVYLKDRSPDLCSNQLECTLRRTFALFRELFIKQETSLRRP